jgi:hypothetical protein
MRRRLYFLLPDVTSARQTVNDLLLARVEDRHMHVLARRGTDLAELHEANVLQKSDIVHGAELGLVLGGAGGLLLGLVLVLAPPHGLELQLVTILVAMIAMALIGAWIASLVGASIPNSRLRAFERDIEAGKILLMVDVRPGRIAEVRNLVRARHPEATGGSIEATQPAFP